MSYSIVISELALKNAASAVDWYEDQRPGLGLLFEEALEACFDRIATNPTAFSYIHLFMRQAKIENFPYMVIFEIFQSAVYISNVFNTHQNPSKKFTA